MITPNKRNIKYPLYLYRDDKSIYKYKLQEKSDENIGYIGIINNEDDLYRLLPNEDKDLVEALIEKTFYMNPDFEEDLPWTEKPMERRKEKEFFEEYGDR